MFYQDYFGPKVLAQMDPEEAFVEVFTAKELWTRFIEGKLGLTKTQSQAILEKGPPSRSKVCKYLRSCFFFAMELKDFVNQEAIKNARARFSGDNL